MLRLNDGLCVAATGIASGRPSYAVRRIVVSFRQCPLAGRSRQFQIRHFREGNIMRTSSVLSILIVALSTPALAADADLKQQVEQIGSAYAESFNKQDAAGIAALYANGGVLVNAAGPHADIV